MTLLRAIKNITVEEAMERVGLTDREQTLMRFLQTKNKPKDPDAVCRLLGMSRFRLIRTKRSLERKLTKLQ